MIPAGAGKGGTSLNHTNTEANNKESLIEAAKASNKEADKGADKEAKEAGKKGSIYLGKKTNKEAKKGDIKEATHLDNKEANNGASKEAKNLAIKEANKEAVKKDQKEATPLTRRGQREVEEAEPVGQPPPRPFNRLENLAEAPMGSPTQTSKAIEVGFQKR